jgi:hypothetical protein
MKVRTVMIIVALLVLLYVGSYLAISTRGRFEPSAIRLTGVKGYQWAPQGFVTDLRWNRSLVFFYYPLYALDIHFWHTSAAGGRYPVNEVPDKDIWKVYKAWKLI